MSEIAITGCKGFHLTFANGWTISVQIGPGNYADNYSMSGLPIGRDANLRSKCAEIAIWHLDGSWYKFADGQDIAAYVPADEVFNWINQVSTF